jgi:hypothetical protein
MTSTPPLVEAVTIFSLVAAGLCLLAGIARSFFEHAATKQRSLTPVQQQAGPDFTGLGKMAEGMAKLPGSGQLLMTGLGLTAVAAAAAGIGSIASAVA